ncbi:hypothetical protein FQA47_020290 [Oryzias melastigma]|uniref:Uncharacterized protein n=1 Tax=Oryzias melastigma TaxID=30732 RepID=A0A834FKN6_ORYME|nr:hypothetical protein FQA47_020290 [Oryzias melastigma]
MNGAVVFCTGTAKEEQSGGLQTDSLLDQWGSPAPHTGRERATVLTAELGAGNRERMQERGIAGRESFLNGSVLLDSGASQPHDL